VLPVFNYVHDDGGRADDVREVAERYGPIRDVYIPRDFYTSGSMRIMPLNLSSDLCFWSTFRYRHPCHELMIDHHHMINKTGEPRGIAFIEYTNARGTQKFRDTKWALSIQIQYGT